MYKKNMCLIYVVLAMFLLPGAVQADLIQHLDASVSSSVTTDVSGEVTQWSDQSGADNNGVDMANIGTPIYPSTSLAASNLEGVDMGTDRNGFQLFSSADSENWLDFTGGASGNSGFCVMIAFKADEILGGVVRDILMGNATPAQGIGFGLKYEGGAVIFYAHGTQYTQSGVTVAAGDTVVYGLNYNASTGAFDFWDSKSGTTMNVTATANADYATGTSVYLGTTGNGDQYMSGMIGEVRIYDGLLNSTDFENAQDDMTYKWITNVVWSPTDPEPDPADGADVVPDSNLTLSWNNQIPATQSDSVYVDVYFGTNPTVTSNPKVLSNEDVTGVSRSSVNVNASVAGETYYWRIDTDYGGAEVLESNVFSFDALEVNVFDNDGEDNLWSTASNWYPDVVPVNPTGAFIGGYDVTVDSVVSSPADIRLFDASLTLTANADLAAGSLLEWDGDVVWNQTGSLFSMDEGYIGIAAEQVNADVVLEGSAHWNFSTKLELGTSLLSDILLTLKGSSVGIDYTGASGSDVFVLGTAATIESRPDSGGASPLELGVAELSLESGSQWILDGSDYTGSYTVGERFYLANYGFFSGSTLGVCFGNFALPADRDLQLVNTGDGSTAGSLYYEVVAQTAATGPNVIIVNIDDVSGGHYFGVEGRDCITPTIDSLAANGINYTNANAASTVCAPSRYAILTGRHARRNTSEAFLAAYPPGEVPRFGNTDVELETDGQNIGALLQQVGYRTAFIGKSHNLDNSLGDTANWPSLGLVTYGQSADPTTDPLVNGAMGHNHRVLCQRMRTYGFDFVGGFYSANLKELYNDYLNVHNQEWITKNALDFIDENHNQRFFLYVAPTMIHGPLNDTDLSPTLAADPGFTSAGYLPNEDYSFMPSRQSIIDEVNTAGKELTSARVTWIDYSMQAIINKLTEHGITNDTLIIFTADHGSITIQDDPVSRGKSSLYEAGMDVPLVMYWPGGITSPGRTYDNLVQHIDFVPTVLELANATAFSTRPLDGESLVPILDGSSDALRDDIYCEIGYARGVRTMDWKYIALRYTPEVYVQIESEYLWYNLTTGDYWPRPYYITNAGLSEAARSTHPGYFDDDQLYDLTADPTEQSNSYGQYPVLEFDLKERLDDYAAMFTDPIQHLDATVSASVTGSPVSQWADQSGNGNDAIADVGSVYYPSSSLSASGLAGLDFGTTRNSLELFTVAESDSWLDQSAGTDGFAVMIAFKCDALHSDWSDVLGNSSSTSGFGLRYSSTGQIAGYLGDQTFQSDGSSLIQAGDTVVIGFNYDAMQGEYEFWDSKNDGAPYGTIGNVSAADFSQASGVTVGSMTDSNQYINGMVGEIIVYEKTLRPAEFHAERKALADKWAADTAVTVPDVLGLAQATAESDIVAAGLVVGTVTTAY
ncbi:MAG: sulfatase-like hydrolase/transferase, partial [Planctomycetes bacterium]|nr:sulfatase-like hydrolase/transferase [Planctomycetota bacterium]